SPNLQTLPTLGDYLKTHIPARVFPPGEVGAYSNYGVALAGYIVERVSGMPMYEYIEKNIYAPLGMTHATFRQPLPAELAPDMSTGYNYLDGEYKAGAFELVAGYPAGSVSASAEDMAKFMLAHLQNGTYGDVQILSEATAQTMHSQLIEYDPRLPGMAHGFFREIINGQVVIHHGGDTLLFHTGFYLLLDQNTGLFISTNSMGGGETREAVFKAFMDRYFPVPPAELVPPADMASRADQYAGEYITTRSAFESYEKIFTLLGPATQVTVNEEGYILVSSAGETHQYVEIEPGLLQNREDPSEQLAFSTLNDGRTYVTTALPFSYVKVAGGEAQMLHLLLWGFSILVFVITLFKWVGAFVRALIKREKQPALAHLARLSGVVYALLLIGFLIAFLVAASDVDPVYQMPRFILDLPSALPFALALPPFLAGVGVVLAVFTPVVWVKRFWNLRGRFGFTLVTLCAWVLVAEFMFWNLL
ncbi:MAG TPA: serine hydrolase domain-containing protein, partial [Anaerolineales bacterium]|nr:serine hydrolase domain-containing protein [Anaerolineales bacterium]